ncbi:MAG: hypothetical protein KKA73_30490 [Chloroflexi bacterium]|nr:hypothetical protein [Chloroflexota bacterium]MBU1752029.1 hypothetical protein [Chloroflexota bacterium]
MPRPDWIDYLVLGVLALALLVGAPILVGRQLSPHIAGTPVVLEPRILAEQAYIRACQDRLLRLADIHQALAQVQELGAVSAQGVFHQAAQAEQWVGEMDVELTRLQDQAPPARFLAIHERQVQLLEADRMLVSEALLYYGDLRPEHVDTIQRGLPVVAEEVAQLRQLLAAMDFRPAEDLQPSAPAPGQPTPVAPAAINLPRVQP